MTHSTKRILHYWICVPGTLFFVLWIVSGAVLVWDSIRGGLHAFPSKKGSGDLHEIETRFQEYLNRIPDPIHRYSAFYIGDLPYILAETKKGTLLLDANDGTILSPLQEQRARIVLTGYSGTDPKSVTRITERNYEYKYGALPAWRGEFSDGRIIHISEQTGEPQSWSDRTGMIVRAMYYYGHAFQFTDSHTANAVIGFFAIIWAAGSVITGLALYIRKKREVLLLIFFIFIFCQGAHSETDMLGRQVSLKTAPQRIVSLAPSCTEIIAALGLQDKLVGITEHTDYPPEVLNLPKVGSYVNLNLEAIAMLNPDLVIATEDGNPEEIVNSLQKLSIPVYVLKLRTYETIQDSIFSLGKFLGRQKEAEIVVENMKSVAACISGKTNGAKRFSVLWVYDQYPIVSAGRDTFTNELIQMAGGDSITGDVSISYPRLTIENVIARNPNVIVVTSMDPSRDRKEREEWWNKWSMIDAVQNKRVYVMQSGLLDRPSPRIVYGLAQLARTFHPEIFSGDPCIGKDQ